MTISPPAPDRLASRFTAVPRSCGSAHGSARGRPELCGVDRALELTAGREPRRAPRRHLDRLAGARVSGLASRALGDREAPKPGDRHLAAGGQLRLDRRQRRLHRAGGLAGRQTSPAGDLLDELALIHARPPESRRRWTRRTLRTQADGPGPAQDGDASPNHGAAATPESTPRNAPPHAHNERTARNAC